MLSEATMRIEGLLVMEKNISIILCKLEKIYSPRFLDSMKHLSIYLACEARVYGLVQYKWMHLFERDKRTVKNKAQVEGSICDAYISKETSNFCSYYFEIYVQSRRTGVR